MRLLIILWKGSTLCRWKDHALVSYWCCDKLTGRWWLRSLIWSELYGLKARCWPGLIPSGSSRREWFPCLFWIPRPLCPWWCPSLTFDAWGSSSASSSCNLSSAPDPLPSSDQGPCGYIAAAQIRRSLSPPSPSLHPICSPFQLLR